MIQLEYGPPVEGGVKHLQYLSDDDLGYLNAGARQLARTVGLCAAALWGYAQVTDNSGLAKKSQGVALASLIVELLIR